MDIKRGIRNIYAVGAIIFIAGALGVRYIKNKTSKPKENTSFKK